MKVYVLCKVLLEDVEILGVYATPCTAAAAVTSVPLEKWCREPPCAWTFAFKKAAAIDYVRHEIVEFEVYGTVELRDRRYRQMQRKVSSAQTALRVALAAIGVAREYIANYDLRDGEASKEAKQLQQATHTISYTLDTFQKP